jgi:D-alanine-D-alanine ligase-like ATP-grasp enzyme
VYCGDSPVWHRQQYIEAGVDSVVSALQRPRTKPPSRLLQFDRSEIIRGVTALVFDALIRVGVVAVVTDPALAGTSRTRSVWNEAVRRGIIMQELRVFGTPRELQRALLPIGPGSTRRGWHYFESIPVPFWRSQYGIGWIDDKNALKRVFAVHQLPVPRGRSVTTLAGARRVLRELGTAVITKPREGSRGRHTTVGITEETELAEAFARAKQLCPFVMVEEYVEGRVYRATCIAGKVIGIMELARPIVVADGVKTVDELRRHHNEQGKAFPQLSDVEDTAFFRMAIKHQGYASDSVPAAGTPVLLAEFSERVNGGYFIDCTDSIPLSTQEVIARAAQVCGVDVVGFDIVSKDLTNSNERFVFLEANSLPYIEIHEIPHAGPVRNVSAAIFDLWNA